MEKYVALLRGINVGGNNIIKMVDLKKTFEDLGFAQVKTYIQSGNVIFSSKNTTKIELITAIENSVSNKFNYHCRIVLLSKTEFSNQLMSAPADFGIDNEKYRYDVIFLKETTTTENALKDIKLRERIDEVFAGENVLFFRRRFIDLSKSKLTKIVSSPIYQHITIRNWKTSIKLLEMMNE